MSAAFYGRCDTCWASLTNRYHSFSWHVEQCVYPLHVHTSRQSIHINIMHSEQLTQYCGAECAEIGKYCQLNDRGILLDIVPEGPIGPCTKCGKPMDLRQPHVAYELMDQTEIRHPWLISVEPHHSETVARLCNACDGDLSGTARDTPADDPEHSGEPLKACSTAIEPDRQEAC